MRDVSERGVRGPGLRCEMGFFVSKAIPAGSVVYVRDGVVRVVLPKRDPKRRSA